MKKIRFILLSILISLLCLTPVASYAVTVDDTYPYIIDTYSTSYDIWNYLNNVIYPSIESSGGSISQADINELKIAVQDVNANVNNINVDESIEKFYESKKTVDDGTVAGHILGFGECMIDTANKYWNSIGEIISESNESKVETSIGEGKTKANFSDFLINPKSYIDTTAYNIFRSLGYSLVLLFFSVSLIENTIKYETFTMKGGAMLCGRLMISKAVIDISGKVCTGIIDICISTCEKLLKSGLTSNFGINCDVTKLYDKSDLWVIGGIVDIFNALEIIVPILIISIPLVICSIFIVIKLITRSFELSLLMIVSPAFFACYSSDVTKQYFKSFVTQFIQVAIQVVFMAVVFFLGSTWLNKTFSATTYKNASEWFSAMIPNLIAMIAITRMMVKPPKVLTNLIH